MEDIDNLDIDNLDSNSDICSKNIEEDKTNKLRMLSLNTYYAKKYNAQKNLMKSIIKYCIPIILLTILRNYNILPPNLYILLTGIVIVIALINIAGQIVDLSNRDNMNFDEYNWYFDKSLAPTKYKKVSLDTELDGKADPWKMPTFTCIGQQCCSKGTIYDKDKNICIPTKICDTEGDIIIARGEGQRQIIPTTTTNEMIPQQQTSTITFRTNE
jgi:hypothetical protein